MMYKLLESDDMGYWNIHTEWLTKEDAEEMRDRHAKCFPDSDWIIEPHDDDDKYKGGTFRNTPRTACDGWEDI
jgi:hypothetical protein